MRGSSGASNPDSAAWSLKFRPIQIILLGLAIGDPKRMLSSNLGALDSFSFNQSLRLTNPPDSKNFSS